MPLFRGEVHTAHYEPGEIIEIDDDQVHLYEGDVEAGFLTALAPSSIVSEFFAPHVGGGALGTPEPETLSTVGQADSE